MKYKFFLFELQALNLILSDLINYTDKLPLETISEFYFRHSSETIAETLRKKSVTMNRQDTKMVTLNKNECLTLGLAFQMVSVPNELLPFMTNLLDSLPAELIQHLQQKRQAS